MFARFQVEGVDDAGGVQRVSGRALNGERFAGDFSLSRLQGHGLSSVPPVGATGLAVFPFGDRSRGYLLGLESTGHRPKATPSGGNVIYGANGEIVSLVQNKVRIVAADIEIAGKIRLSGSELTHNGVDISDTHRHKDTMPGGGQTGTPA